MRTEVIPNQYDGPRKPEKRLGGGSFSLDYANSDDAAEIDQGIRETVKGIRLSILAVGIGLAKIKARGLYIDLKHRNMAKYIESLCDEFAVNRGSLHNWLYIGEAFLKYRKELDKVGFSDEDGPTKLPYVDRALAIYRKEDVFRAV
jgi:3-dehydroquinate synthase class II